MKLYVADGISPTICINVHAWSCIKDVKDQLSNLLHIPQTKQRLFHAAHELKNTHTVNDCLTDGATLFLISSPSTPSASSASASSTDHSTQHLISIYGDIHCEPDMQACIHAARAGLSIGLTPRLAVEGTGGTYFLRSRSKQQVAVFKAEDEEPFAPNNPRGYVGVYGGPGMRAGLLSGEGAVREVAAYLMDHQHLASVPPTTRVEMSMSLFSSNTQTNTLSQRDAKNKIGSLQAFVEFDELSGDLDPALFPIDEVQKIALLDIRLFNIDRNEANILVKRRYADSDYDDTLSIPSSQSSQNGDLSPQSSQLFSPSSAVYSRRYDPPNLHGHMQQHSPPESSLITFSPPFSPASTTVHYTNDSPALTPSTAPQSPPNGHPQLQRHSVSHELSASFNLNYPIKAAASSSLFMSDRSPSIPIPIPVTAHISPSVASTVSATHSSHFSPTISSSLPIGNKIPPSSRLQARLAALKAHKQQQERSDTEAAYLSSDPY